MGKRLKYLAFIEDCPVAALSWSAPAKRLGARDKFIGWSDDSRQRSLHRIAANSRFVIFPWVQIPNFGSHILGMNLRCLRKDWLETFHDEHFIGRNFCRSFLFPGNRLQSEQLEKIGRTKGYTKCGKRYIYHGQIKEIYIYILDSCYRKILGVPSTDFLEHRLSKNVEETSLSLQQSEWTPELLEEFELTDHDFDSIAQELTEFHNIFSDCFCPKRARKSWFDLYFRLMSATEKKNCREDRPGIKTPQSVRSTQRFLKTYKWDHGAMLQMHQQQVVQQIATEDGMITVDPSEFPKKERNPLVLHINIAAIPAKKDNCQSGVFIGYVSGKGHGSLMLNYICRNHG